MPALLLHFIDEDLGLCSLRVPTWTFLGRKWNGNYQDEMGNRFNTRIEGTRIKHTMGPVSIKMYDKFRLILRMETTVLNVSFFKHYRAVEHRNGTRTMAWAEMKKSIYSLAPLRELLQAANRRYLEFISTIEDDKAGTDKLDKISQPVEENDRGYRGFNFFDPADEELFRALGSGEFNISGFQNKDLRRRLKEKTTGQISRLTKRLRVHGLIKKVWPDLQKLRHSTRQASSCTWPQTEKSLHHSRTVIHCCSLIRKFCQI